MIRYAVRLYIRLESVSESMRPRFVSVMCQGFIMLCNLPFWVVVPDYFVLRHAVFECLITVSRSLSPGMPVSSRESLGRT